MATLSTWSSLLLHLTLGAAFIPIVAITAGLAIASALDALDPTRPLHDRGLISRALFLASSCGMFLILATITWVWFTLGLLTWPAVAVGLVLLAYISTPVNRPSWLPERWLSIPILAKLFW